ncbi:hypothetical protein [Streptomyces flavovirens]
MIALAPRSRSGRAVAAVALALAVVGGLFAGYGANVFGPDRLCRGWITGADAERALPGGGRLGESQESASTCTVERSGWWPWGEKRRLTVRVVSEKPRFPFEMSLWNVSGASALLTGPVTGAVDRWGGWAFLPEECVGTAPGTRSGERPTVRVSLSRDEALDTTARIVSAAVGGVSRQSGCEAADSSGADTPSPLRPSAVTNSDLDEVCGVPGFALPGLRGPGGARVREQTSGSFDSAWFCDLSFAGDDDGPFTRIGVVKTPELTASLQDTGVRRFSCGGRETYVALDDLSYPWEPEERRAAGLVDQAELGKLLVDGLRGSAACG